jgi:signal transduction histidine kinase
VWAFDIGDVLEQSLTVADNAIRYRARVVRDFDHAGCVEANSAQLSQVFVNLLVNAAQALPERGIEHNQIRVSARAEGATVVVEVADNGCGISSELQARIFEPFFTTKEVRAGMGLGLSISRTIVEGFDGSLSMESNVGLGSVFRVRLPAATRQDTRRPPPPAGTTAGAAVLPAAATRPRVLVVDDEPTLARVMQRILATEFDVDIARDCTTRLPA